MKYIDKLKGKSKIKYLNKYNQKIMGNYLYGSKYISAILWVFVLVAFFTYGIVGSLVVFFVGFMTIIVKGIKKGVWKAYSEVNVDENKTKDKV